MWHDIRGITTDHEQTIDIFEAIEAGIQRVICQPVCVLLAQMLQHGLEINRRTAKLKYIITAGTGETQYLINVIQGHGSQEASRLPGLS